jgi:uncharacterized protein YjbI with pentapeptide repeats
MFYELKLDEGIIELLRGLEGNRVSSDKMQITVDTLREVLRGATKEELKEVLRKKLRKELEAKLNNYGGNKIVILNLEPKEIEKIIFKVKTNHLVEALDFELIKRLDLTGVSFDGVDIRKHNFKGSYGVQINPQTVYQKDCCKVNFCDTEIIGGFVDAFIVGADFTGSYGAKINPQTVSNMACMFVNFCDAELVGLLDGADICGAKLDGVIISRKESKVKKRAKKTKEI